MDEKLEKASDKESTDSKVQDLKAKIPADSAVTYYRQSHPRFQVGQKVGRVQLFSPIGRISSVGRKGSIGYVSGIVLAPQPVHRSYGRRTFVNTVSDVDTTDYISEEEEQTESSDSSDSEEVFLIEDVTEDILSEEELEQITELAAEIDEISNRTREGIAVIEHMESKSSQKMDEITKMVAELYSTK